MRKLIIILTIATLVFSVTACGENSKKNESTDTGNSASSYTESNNNTPHLNGGITEEMIREHKETSEKDFKFTETQTNITITDYIGSDEIVVIPEIINGKKVDKIARYTFANESAVKGVLIPSHIKSLEDTFVNNANVEVVICEGVEKIGYVAFGNCTALRKVLLTGAVNELGESAFFSCTSLEEIYLSNNLKSIDEKYALTVFYWCNKLTIKGEKGSFIEQFALNNGIKFSEK